MSVMRCEFVPTSEPDKRGRRWFRCRRFGCTMRAHTHHPPERIIAACEGWESGMQLGNKIEWVLKTLGITQEKWARWWGKEGNGCEDCEARKQWLNSLVWLNRLSDPGWYLHHAKPVLRIAQRIASWLFGWMP